MPLHISDRTREMPASAIRKLVPLSDAAKAQGVKVFHLNVGAPDIKSPDCAFQAVIDRCTGLHHLSYTNSAGLMELREGLVNRYYKKIGIDIEVSELLVDVAGSEAFAVAMQIAAGPGEEIPLPASGRRIVHERAVQLDAGVGCRDVTGLDINGTVAGGCGDVGALAGFVVAAGGK